MIDYGEMWLTAHQLGRDYRERWEKAEQSREGWKTAFWLLAAVVLARLYIVWVTWSD